MLGDGLLSDDGLHQVLLGRGQHSFQEGFLMLVLHLDANAYYYEDGKDHTEYDQAAVVIHEMSLHELIECQ